MTQTSPLRAWLAACPTDLVIREDDGSAISITISATALEYAFEHVVSQCRKNPPNHRYTVASGWGPTGIVSAIRTAGARDKKPPLTRDEQLARERIRLAYQTVRKNGGEAILRGDDERAVILKTITNYDGKTEWQVILQHRTAGFDGFRQGIGMPALYRNILEHLETTALTLSFTEYKEAI